MSALRYHLLENRLDLEEFSTRLGQVYAAGTVRDLAEALRGLPAPPTPGPPPLPARRQRKDQRRFQRELATWEAQRAAKQARLDLARGHGPELPLDFLPVGGERLLVGLPNTALRLWATVPGHTVHSTASVSNRGMLGARRRSGTTHTYKVPDREVLATTDTGTLYITNRRLVFRGPKRTLDLPIAAPPTAGIKLDDRAHQIVVSVQNGRPVTYGYSRGRQADVGFALELAAAEARGATSSMLSRLAGEVEAHATHKPVAPPPALSPTGPYGPGSGLPRPASKGPFPPRRRRRASTLGALDGNDSLAGARDLEVPPRRYNQLVGSWWVLLTLPMGLLTWAGFLYAGFRAKRRDLFVASAVYGLALAIALVLPPGSAVAGLILVFVWVAGMVHSLIVRRGVCFRTNSRLSRLSAAKGEDRYSGGWAGPSPS